MLSSRYFALTPITVIMSSTKDFYLNTIQQKIDATKCLNDLLPFLSLLSIDLVKAIVKEEIKNTCNYPHQSKTAYFTSLSMTDLLPSDIIQHIVSFNSSQTIEPINSIFKSFSKRNKKQQIKQEIERKYPNTDISKIEIDQMYLEKQIIKTERMMKHHEQKVSTIRESCRMFKIQFRLSAARIYALHLVQNARAGITTKNKMQNNHKHDNFVVDIEYDTNINKTWIVAENPQHPTMIILKDMIGVDTIHTSFGSVLHQCKSGDKIWLYNGTYSDMDKPHYEIKNKNVQIIGKGDSVTIQDVTNSAFFVSFHDCKMYFENIFF